MRKEGRGSFLEKVATIDGVTLLFLGMTIKL